MGGSGRTVRFYSVCSESVRLALYLNDLHSRRASRQRPSPPRKAPRIRPHLAQHNTAGSLKMVRPLSSLSQETQNPLTYTPCSPRASLPAPRHHASPSSPKSTTSPRRKKSRSKKPLRSLRSRWTARRWASYPEATSNPHSCTSTACIHCNKLTRLAAPSESRRRHRPNWPNSQRSLTPTKTATPHTSPSLPSARSSSTPRTAARPPTTRSWTRRFGSSRTIPTVRLRWRI